MTKNPGDVYTVRNTTRRKKIVLWVFIILFLALLAVALEAAVTFNQALAIGRHEEKALSTLDNIRQNSAIAMQRSDIGALSNAFDSQDVTTIRTETDAADKIAHNGNWNFLAHLPFARADVTSVRTMTGTTVALSHQILDDYHSALIPWTQMEQTLLPATMDASALATLRQQFSSALDSSQKSLNKAVTDLQTQSRLLDSVPNAHIGAINAAVSQARSLVKTAIDRTKEIDIRKLARGAVTARLSAAGLPSFLVESLGL